MPFQNWAPLLKYDSHVWPVNFSDAWTDAFCSIKYNHLNDHTTQEKIVVITHEVGHALSLGHTDPEYATTREVMDSVLSHTYMATSINDIDKVHLRKRWGGTW